MRVFQVKYARRAAVKNGLYKQVVCKELERIPLFQRKVNGYTEPFGPILWKFWNLYQSLVFQVRVIPFVWSNLLSTVFRSQDGFGKASVVGEVIVEGRMVEIFLPEVE